MAGGTIPKLIISEKDSGINRISVMQECFFEVYMISPAEDGSDYSQHKYPKGTPWTEGI